MDWRIIADITRHIDGMHFEEPAQIDFYDAHLFICQLVNGSLCRSDHPLMNLGTEHAALAKPQAAMSDAELLLTVLQHCDDRVLAKLEAEFQTQTKLAELIRRYRTGHRKVSLQDDGTIRTIGNMLRESEQSGNVLYQQICEYMLQKGFKTDADFYNSISMSRQSFARIRNKSKSIGKHTVLWIIVGLGLDYFQAVKLLATAGYAFKSTDKRDMILSYILQNVSDYTLADVNDILYHFGLKLLCEENL